MAKSGFRKIVVDGVGYKWKAIYSKPRILGWSPNTIDLLVIGPYSSNLRVPLISKHWTKEHVENPDCAPTHKASLTPKDVEKCIRECLNEGWNKCPIGVYIPVKHIELADYETL